MSRYSRKLNYEKTSNFSILPIAFVITVVPLIVFMRVMKLSEIEIKNWIGGETNPDFFASYKSQWLIIGTILTMIFFFMYSIIKGFEIKKSIIYIPVITYTSLIVLSTMTSDYKEVALKGFVARYEGMWVLLCYLALFVITFNLVKSESHIKFLLGALLISAAIIGIIGVFQFFKMDIFRTDFGKRLILPQAYHEYADTLKFRFRESYVYASFSNTNYMGSYVVLLLPIAFIALFNFKKIYMKIGAGLLMTALLICLYGSRSSAGVVGVIIIALLMLIIFRKSIFKKKVLSIIVVAALVAGVFGANYVMDGALINKLQTTIKREIGAERPVFDLKDIIFEDNTVSIVSGTEILMIEIDEEGQLQFYDGYGNSLKTKVKEKGKYYEIRFKDEKYKAIYRYLKVEGTLIKLYPQYAQFQLRVMKDKTFNLIGSKGELIDKIQKPKTLGFVGKEKLGSNRGYIWSRTLPLLKNTLVWGYGPDTYAIVFPQDDYIGKIRAFSDYHTVVDKPHNMYLQMGVNTGVLSLVAFIALLGIYAIQSLTIYINIDKKDFLQYTGAGIFIALCGYLATCLFNDSVVGIAPIFWVLLGLGFVCNRLVTTQRSAT